MAIPTFTPPVAPSPGTTITPTVALNEATFGDGYAQASRRGINNVRRRVVLRWDALTLDDARTIETFLEGRGGCDAFFYTIRGEAAPRKWTCPSWSMSDDAPATFRAELVECFANDS